MQNTLLTIITFIFVFGILVFVHELGHFFFAKKSGVLVREFSIGMGPKLVAFRRGTTSYTIRILPVGGYVRMAGAQEDESDELQPGTMVTIQMNDANQVIRLNASQKKQTLFQGIPVQISEVDLVDGLWIKGYENGDESEIKTFAVNHDATIIEPDGTEVQIAPKDVQFQSAKLWQRALINFAGSLNNFILAVVVFAIIGLMQGFVPSNTTTLGHVVENSVAQKAGLKDGDTIVKVANHPVKNWTELQTMLQSRPGKATALVVKQGSTTKSLTLTPATVHSNGQKFGQIGVEQVIKRGVGDRLLYGFTGAYTTAANVLHALANLFHGGFSLNKLGGPVAIFANTEQAAKAGFISVLLLLAFLSINIGIVNLLPIPALDGGKLLLNLVEAIRRKPLSEDKENMVQIAGFIFLMLLMLAVTFNDVIRYFIK
ncbi:RIP metalloprotease RseP [Periweissella ghanensis]|uniref:Zinc metalloprotease n=1 Tax=Periweissella ghanensis TaxID=467997 RepID=A0ABM8ZB82_9LACO|nr:RIP metalloprotease RseP [Periweissella ghanensis]MCM0600677.1 RIP metalloprotease RseP [Periweissella ghanensis]CAH0418433.1 Regulator of sigma-W protease RasP [Periweissella ghanensis]